MQFLRQIYYLFRRGFRQSVRPYFALLPEYLMPIMFFVINSAGFQRAVDIPGFTADTYLAFYAPVALFTAIYFSTGSTGIEVAADLTTGYMDRLFVSPIYRSAILIGKLLAMGVRAASQCLLMLGLVMLFGAPFAVGWAGLPILLLLALIFGMGWAGLGLCISLFTKNPRVVQSGFVFFMPFTLITTAQLPLELLTGWYKTVVLINPITYILEGFRSLMLRGFEWDVLIMAFLVAILFSFVTLGLSAVAFRRLSR